MIITFFSNYFNHHQRALCDSLSSIEGVEFYFVETEPMEEFRSNMGWGVSELPSYVIQAHKGDVEREAALELSIRSDAVIIGSAPEWYIEKRLEQNKLIFRYTERPMKEGWIKMFIPRLAKKFYRLHYKNRNKNMYVLGASAYAAYDYKLLRSYDGKCLKFGYFPEGEELDFDSLMALKNKDDVPRILWTGRFLKLKRADLLVDALGIVRDRGIDFKLRFIGNGEEAKHLHELVEKNRLSDRVCFGDFVKPAEARRLMEEADLYVMTSNNLEGWGSVIYESLSAGCGVIASHACGSTPWLVKPNVTGLIFKSGSVNSLADKLERFLTDKELRYRCQKNAYEQMKSLWNPQVAAQRIVEFTEAILKDGSVIEYADGPLSKSEILKNNWYRE